MFAGPANFITHNFEKTVMDIQYSNSNNLIIAGNKDSSVTLYRSDTFNKFKEFFPYHEQGSTLKQIIPFKAFNKENSEFPKTNF